MFHCRTKVPFMGQLGRIQEHPQRGENVGFSHHPLSSFSDLKINKRQVQQHRGRRKNVEMLKLLNSAKNAPPHTTTTTTTVSCQETPKPHTSIPVQTRATQ